MFVRLLQCTEIAEKVKGTAIYSSNPNRPLMDLKKLGPNFVWVVNIIFDPKVGPMGQYTLEFVFKRILFGHCYLTCIFFYEGMLFGCLHLILYLSEIKYSMDNIQYNTSI